MQSMARPTTSSTRKPRGVNADPEKRAAMRQELRETKKSLTNCTTAELQAIDPDTFVITPKAREFVKFWAQGDTVLNASVRAGYTDNGSYAYRLVHVPAIRALYQQEKDAYAAASNMTRKQVIDGLLEGIEMAKLLAEPASVITGWKTIGQMCGYFEPIKRKVELTVNGQVVMKQMEQMSEAELARILSTSLPEIADAGDDHGDD